MKIRHLLSLCFAFLMLLGCAATGNFKDPQVSIKRIELAQGEQASNIVPKFLITLDVVNPNESDLKLAGLTYQLTINGERVVTGADNKLPIIKAYGQSEVVLTAKPDIFSGMSLLKAIMTNRYRTLNYRVDITLDPGKLYPNINIEKAGTISSLLHGDS